MPSPSPLRFAVLTRPGAGFGLDLLRRLAADVSLRPGQALSLGNPPAGAVVGAAAGRRGSA